MAHNNIEIEIQVTIENVKPLLRFLQNNATFLVENRQVDEYFSPGNNDFLKKRPVSEWLRLRDAGSKGSINYKNWHYGTDGKSHYCDEFETTIDDAKSAKNILLALGYKVIVTVNKLRKTYRYNDYEIALDTVKGLGEFVEVEYISKNKRVMPAEVTAGMIDFLKKLNCGKIARNYVGYPFLLLFPEEATFEEL